MSDYWFGTMDFFDFPIILGIIIPTDKLIFFRGVGLNHQPDTILTIINHIIAININHILTRYINQPIVGRWLSHQPDIVSHHGDFTDGNHGD